MLRIQISRRSGRDREEERSYKQATIHLVLHCNLPQEIQVLLQKSRFCYKNPGFATINPDFAAISPDFAMHCCICAAKRSVKHACYIAELLCRH